MEKMKKFHICGHCFNRGHYDESCPNIRLIPLKDEEQLESSASDHLNGKCDCPVSDEPACDLEAVLDNLIEADDCNQWYYKRFVDSCECKTCLCILRKLKQAPSPSNPVDPQPHPIDDMELSSHPISGSVSVDVVGTIRKRKCKTCGKEGHIVGDLDCPFSVEKLPFHERNVSAVCVTRTPVDGYPERIVVTIGYQCDGGVDDKGSEDSDEEEEGREVKRQRLL